MVPDRSVVAGRLDEALVAMGFPPCVTLKRSLTGGEAPYSSWRKQGRMPLTGVPERIM